MTPEQARAAWGRPLPATPIVLVMGVAGSGKTTVGRLLAQRLEWNFADADQFHPAANIAKMSAGTPLTDADRMPWLRTIGTWIDVHGAVGRPGVVTCSALKRSYRALLTKDRPEVLPVFLDGDSVLIARRMAQRSAHFFRRGMLDGQFRILERPAPDEHILVLPITETADDLVSLIAAAVRP
ncbi:gluconokinase [Actinomadura oligospora]|uniref:gluconokinase n=1 Tax=Actinomadura oligospora TaxID=111804 RepID=UPI0004B0100B|nr:gluconokinase [Actinomadura oligospora]